MSRTIKSVKRPEEHAFIEDLAEPPEFNGERRCARPRCGLPRSNSVHIPAGELFTETPDGDRSSEILGEGSDAA